MRMLLAVVAVVVMSVGVSSAQRDLAAELVGTWQGTQQQLSSDRGGETTSRERTLIVRSVKRTGDGWAVDASFGVSGEKLARFRGAAAPLQETGADVTLTLTYTSGTHVTLRLVGKDWLEGEHHTKGTNRGRIVSLKRVSTTPKKSE